MVGVVRANYQQLISWSPMFGGECARVSIVDEHGGEYYALLPFTEGRAFNTLRARALEALSEAVASGLEPGEIRWR